jgi:WhiB family redox-sensing transcriptional regulator
MEVKMTVDVPCVVGPADLWFSDVPGEIDRARALCAGCPLRAECLRGALERRETCGVWGGELFIRGLPVPSPKRNGRPRKDAEMTDAVLRAQMAERIHSVLASV